MPESDDWIQQTLTRLRKLDRAAQRSHLEQVLNTITAEEREALRRAIETLQAKVQVEVRAYQTRRQADADRKTAQKEAMLSRYNWLLHIIHKFRPSERAS